MMINTRIQNKHDVEANWNNSSLIPMAGEIIVYDRDDNYNYERFKIGDGITNINALPFALDIILEDAKAYVDEAILGGAW